MSKKKYFILGTGRCGTSMLAAILDKAGADFGDVSSRDTDRVKGYFESMKLYRAHQWFTYGNSLSKTSLPYPHFLMKHCVSRAYKNLKKSLSGADWHKVPQFHYNLARVSKLDYEPVVIAVWRDFLPTAISFHKKNHTSYKDELSRWVDVNSNLLFLLKIYKGCLIKFDDILESDNWAKKISDISGLNIQSLLKARDEIIDSRSHPQYDSKKFLPPEYEYLHELLNDAT